MHSAGRPWWQQATALVSLGAGGAITGFSFAPGAAADVASPTSMPVHLMALERAAQPAPADDVMLRTAIVNVANYYLKMAQTKTPAEMEAIIWQHDSLDGVDHGESCAAFASMTLELAAQAVGQQSWVSGGTTYPWPLHNWADVRVDPNPSSLGITSILQDAEAHGRWHPLGHGYQPQPGDWVLFDGHVEVVTKYSRGVLSTVGGDSLPNFSVNAHTYSGPLSAAGVAGFVDNGLLPATTGNPAGDAQGRSAASGEAQTSAGAPGGTGQARAADAAAGGTEAGGSQAQIPGMAAPEEQTLTGHVSGGDGAGEQASAAASAAVPGVPTTGAGAGASAGSAASAGSGTRAGSAASAGSGTRAGTAASTGTGPSGASGPSGGSTASAGTAAGARSAASAGSGTRAGTGPASDASTSSGGGAGSGIKTGGASGAGSDSAQAGPGAPATTAPHPGQSAHGSAATHASRAAHPVEPVRPGQTAQANQSARSGRPARAHQSPQASGTSQPEQTASRGTGPANAAAEAPAASAAIPGLSAVSPGDPPGLAPGAYQRHQPAPETSQAQADNTQQAFINQVAPGAIAAQRKYGIPAAVTIAQAIDESAWGQSTLATQDHNLFGIKGSGTAGSGVFPTQEYINGQWVTENASFAAYHDIADSIQAHSELLANSGYYAEAMADRGSADDFANALTGVYATSPDYGTSLVHLMRQYDLYRYDTGTTGTGTTGTGTTGTGTTGTGTTGTATNGTATNGTAGPAASGAGGASAATGGPRAHAPTATSHPASSGGRPARTTPASTAPSATVPSTTAPHRTPPPSTAPSGTAPASPSPAGSPAATPTASPTGTASSAAPTSSPHATAPGTTRSPATGTGNTGTGSTATGSAGTGSAGTAPGATAPAGSRHAGTQTPATAGGHTGNPAPAPQTAAPQVAVPSHSAAATVRRATPSVPASGGAGRGGASGSANGARSGASAPSGAAIPGLPAGDSASINGMAYITPWNHEAASVQLGPAAYAASPVQPARPGRRAPADAELTAAYRPMAGARPTAAAPERPAQRPGAPARGTADNKAKPKKSSGTKEAAAPAAAVVALGGRGKRGGTRKGRKATARYEENFPPAVRNAFLTTARTPLIRAEPLYRDVAEDTGIPWEVLAACHWMQCEARPGYSPVCGEKLGTVNPDGTVYRTPSEALAQCAVDLASLADAVYGIDLAGAEPLSVRDLAKVFAAFRWGGLLELHNTSAMEFPYSVAGLTAQHMNMRWPRIDDRNTPDKPGSRFRRPFGAVPIVIGLNYPATV